MATGTVQQPAVQQPAVQQPPGQQLPVQQPAVQQPPLQQPPGQHDSRYCFVCGKEEIYLRAKSKAAEKHKLGELLQEYGGVSIVEGGLCRSCLNHLKYLDTELRDFKQRCHSTLAEKQQRLASKPKTKKSRKNPPDTTDEASTAATSSARSTAMMTPPNSQPMSSADSPSIAPIAARIVTTPPNPYPTPPSSADSPSPAPLAPRIVPDDAVQSTPPSSKPKKRPVPRALPDTHDYASETIKKRKYHVRMQEPPKDLKQLLSPAKDCYISENDYQRLWSALQTRSCGILAAAVVKDASLRDFLLQALAEEIKTSSSEMNSRKRGEISYLMEKDISSLDEFSWSKVLEEACSRHPSLMILMASCLLDAGKEDKITRHLPRLGMAYSILVQGRNDKLSLVQRLTSLVLYDNLADQKLYDRLQPLGVTLSYSAFNNLIKVVSTKYEDRLVSALLNEQRFRIVGDNVNWKVGVSEERLNHHGHMEHAFGSLAVIQNADWSNYPDVAPQAPHQQMPVENFLLSHEDWDMIKDEYMVLIGRVLVKHVPWFTFLQNVLPVHILREDSAALTKENEVVSLPLLYKSEQDYDQVADILDSYEDLIKRVYAKAGIPLDVIKIHIGGDQLTRERLMGCILLALGIHNEPDRWKHLGPVTFELFHMNMNFLMLIFTQLYDEDSEDQIGTMCSAQHRISRNNVDKDVRKAYDEDKDFVLSYVDMHIVEAGLQHFQIDGVLGRPKFVLPPEPGTEGTWAREHLRGLISALVAPKMDDMLQKLQDGEVVVDGRFLNLQLRNGGRLPLMLPADPPGAPQVNQQTDQVKNYAHRVLELGLIFKSLLDQVHLPDRDRGLRLMKYAMMLFRQNTHQSKYAYEIMRFLVHQQCTLSERGAREEYYALFVNTNGKVDGHVACDDRMEWSVNGIKKHGKHMSSNRTEQHVSVRVSALGGVKIIAKQFDETTDPITRSRKHSVASALKDEAVILGDLRKLRPFQQQAGRRHLAFPCRTPTTLAYTDVPELKTWAAEKKYKFGSEKI